MKFNKQLNLFDRSRTEAILDDCVPFPIKMLLIFDFWVDTAHR